MTDMATATAIIISVASTGATALRLPGIFKAGHLWDRELLGCECSRGCGDLDVD